MLSKRATLVAFTVLAALSVEIGCGDGTHKQPVRLNKTIAQKEVAAKPVQKGPDGKPIQQSLNPKADANAAQITQAQAQLDSGAPMVREDLVSGDYTLTSVSTYIKYDMGTDTGLVLKQSNYDSKSVHLTDSGNASESGTIPTFQDSPATGRLFQLPVSFSITTPGTWDNNIESVGSRNVELQDKVTPNAGKLTAVDNLQNPELGMKASVLKILSEGTFNQQSNAYILNTDDGVEASVALEKTDATTLTVRLSFAEKQMAKVDTTHTQSTTYYRTFFIRYSIAAKPAKNAGPTSPSTITIVNSGGQQQQQAAPQQQMDPNTVGNVPASNPPPAQLTNDEQTPAPAEGDASTVAPAAN